MKNPTELIKTFSAIVSRAILAAKLGKQYGTDRDLYEALGYPTELTYADYLMHYSRQDIAAAIIDKPIKYTWRGDIIIDDETDNTVLKDAWIGLMKRLQLKSKFVRLDKLTSLGKYGILLLGLDDVRNSSEFKNPVQTGVRKLLYVKPFGEGGVTINQWEENTNNSRFGLPLIYQIEVSANEQGKMETIKVHHSRVIHVAGELLTSEVEGIPVLQKVYNRLMDLEKLVGGSAEMFWRGARPGYHTKVDPEFQMTAIEEDKLKDQINEYEHHLRRILTTEGVDIKSLSTQVSDPQNHVEVQLQMISAATGIPKRILVGSERGELASSQDKTGWLEEVQSRREEYVEIQIVRVFIDFCIKYKILPTPKNTTYTIEWEDLFAPSEKEKAEVGKIRATALKDYISNPVLESVITPEAFFKFFLGLKENQVNDIIEMRDAEIIEEVKSIDEEEQIDEE